MRRHCSSSVLLPCVALALLLAACSQSSAAKPPSPTPTTTATATVTPAAVTLPAFADWRVAYVDASDYLHAVSLDGKTDLAGPQLAGLTANGTGVVAAGFSPDGHLLAYEGGIMVEHLPDGKVTSLASAATAAGAQRALGWIDATHLAVTLHPSQNNPGTVPTQGIDSLDITTGHVRTLVTFSSQSLGTPHFSLATDGTKALFYNQPYRSDPFTPQVDMIDTTSGAVTPLPHITGIMGGNTFSSLAWRPGTHTVAASTGYKENNNLKPWLLDLAHDTATPLAVTDYPAGWAPDGGTLILTSGWQSLINEGPLQLTAVSFPANGTPAATVLTKSAYTFTFLGFVKTA